MYLDNTNFTVEDLMFSGIEEYHLSSKDRKVTALHFLASTTKDMFDYVKLLLKKIPSNFTY